MSIANTLKALWEKFINTKNQIITEESTKNAFVMPFIQALGYNVFDPQEVIPEFTADVGIKKWEKVDYCIFRNSRPIIIIECKHWNQDLSKHDSQLFRYFHVTKARFAILTNGYEYKFFTDLEEKNKMDMNPFLSINLTDETTFDIKQIEQFAKEQFNELTIIDAASRLKTQTRLLQYLQDQFNSPESDFVKFLGGKVYEWRLTTKVIDKLRPLITTARKKIINDSVASKLDIAISKIHQEYENQHPVSDIEWSTDNDDEIETTLQELEWYFAVKSMVKWKIDLERIIYKDTKSYLWILIDDNNRQPLCRLYFNGKNKYIGIFDEDKNEQKYLIESINDVYKYSTHLRKRAAIF